MPASAFGSVEMEMLWLSVWLGLAQLLISVFFNLLGRGLAYGVGPRDEPPAPLGRIASRSERALRNFLETFAFFAAAILMANALGKHSATSVLGAQIYFWTRLAYVPAYMLGIPVLRTVLWIASLAGIGMVMRCIWPGM
jgi:uncharacterized MAPEG superfamily protein